MKDRYLVMSATATTTRDVRPPRRRSSRFQRAPSSSPTLILLVILTCQLMVVLDATIVNVALPDIQAALHFSPANLSWVLNAYTLTFGGLLLLGARAGDILGRRRTFLAGIAIFIVASLVGGFATSGGFLLAARAAQGIGGALAAPSALALLTTMFAEGRERMRALGLYTRRLHRRQRRRPGAGRHAHRLGVLAMGAVRQRADRGRRPGGRPKPSCPRPRATRGVST